MTTNFDAIAAELRKLAEKATPGPWFTTNGKTEAFVETKDQLAHSSASVCHSSWWNGSDPVCPEKEDTLANMAFIAAANPANILALLDEREHLMHELSGAEGALYRIMPNVYTVGAAADPFEGPGETYAAAYERTLTRVRTLEADLADARAEVVLLFNDAKENAQAAVEAREAVNVLAEALDNLLTYDRVTRPAFRLRPVGGPDSLVRVDQEELIKCEDDARASLSHPAVVKIRGNSHD